MHRVDTRSFWIGRHHSAGLRRELDRVTVARISFFLAIPAMTAAGGYEATLVSFVIAYASIALAAQVRYQQKISVHLVPPRCRHLPYRGTCRGAICRRRYLTAVAAPADVRERGGQLYPRAGSIR